MAEASEHEWELNRENVRPLRSGRTVKSINSFFGGKHVFLRIQLCKENCTSEYFLPFVMLPLYGTRWLDASRSGFVNTMEVLGSFYNLTFAASF